MLNQRGLLGSALVAYAYGREPVEELRERYAQGYLDIEGLELRLDYLFGLKKFELVKPVVTIQRKPYGFERDHVALD